MPRQEKVITIFVASPNDVVDERTKLEEVINELNITWSRNLGLRFDLVRWETHAFPGIGDDPQDVINEQIPDDYDIFIGIMWCRFGTPTGRAGSGTAEEFQRAKTRYDADPSNLKIMMYFKDEAISPSRIDPDQINNVNEFRKSLGEDGALHWKFSTVEDFEQIVRLHLTRQAQSLSDQGTGTVTEFQAINQPSSSNEKTCDEDFGVLDLVETFEDSIDELEQITTRISDSIEELGTKVKNHAEEFAAIPRDLEGNINRRTAKKRLALVATDMNLFNAKINEEIPSFNNAISTGINAYIKSVPMYSVFAPQSEIDKNVKKVVPVIISTREAMLLAKESIDDFRSEVAALPSLTSQLNRAKAATVTILDKLIAELNNGQTLLTEAEAVSNDK